ncbi:phosphatidylserine decarboxylase [Azotosporobacter soli]|uniref:phosphatidylserine decarboxylase n=1 Tax=Azotosporobacter soli TaxID=3055040 RepID=UPI0031FE4A5D
MQQTEHIVDLLVKYQKYTCGKLKPADKKSALIESERHTIGLENEKTKIMITQVTGVLARSIVSWVALGDEVQQGQRYGMIKARKLLCQLMRLYSLPKENE